MKRTIILTIVLSFLLLTFSVSSFATITISREISKDIQEISDPIEEEMKEEEREFTHTVLGEEASATWCPHCPPVVGYMDTIYSSGSYDFYYVTLVCDMNTYANARRIELGITGYPTVAFDGGYQTLVGNQGSTTPYINAINTCGARTVPDVDLGINVQWLGDAEISVVVDVTNNEASTYNGHLHVYVTEIVSRWVCYGTVNYDYAMIGDYAINMNVNVPAGQTLQYSDTWDGDTYGVGDITVDNIQLVAAVFSQTSPNYADETTAATPTWDTTPPDITNIQVNPPSQIPGGSVNISATVTDDSDLDTVEVTITPPGGSSSTYAMTNIPSTDIYYYEATYTTIGTYDFSIYAEDIYGNDITSSIYHFVIGESIPPVIQDIDAPFYGPDWAHITCEVTDNVEVDEVSINITDPNGGYSTAMMTNTPGTDYYYYNTSYSLIGAYSFYIWAKDTSGNQIISEEWIIMRKQMHSEWNLMSVPVENSWTAETLGENIAGCTVVTKFKADTQTFLTHVVGIPYNDFAIENGVGYFIYATTDSIFVAIGPAIETSSVDLYAGWDMIGWYHDYDTTAESLGSNIEGCTVVTMYDASTQMFTTHVVGIPYNDFQVTAGMGTFIYVTAPSTWYGEG